MKEKIISILLNPFVISFLITIPIIILLPDYFPHFKIDIVKEGQLQEDVKLISYCDLNNDNKTEKISFKVNILGNSALTIYNDNDALLDQWNLHGKFPQLSFEPSYFDFDKNGCKEIYIITQEEDSAFLNIIDPWEKENDLKKIFLCTIQKKNNHADFSPGYIHFSDLNNDGSDEIVFSINGGFSVSPRRIYAIDLKNYSVSCSKHIGNRSNITRIVDINNDGNPEIILATYSSGNFSSPEISEFNDYSTWIVILNNKLEFYIDPIEIPVPFSAVQLLPIKTNMNRYNLIGVIDYRKNTPSIDKLFQLKNGKIDLSIELVNGQYQLYDNDSDEKEVLLFDRQSGILKYLDADFNIISSYDLISNSSLFIEDLNNDGENEFILTSLVSSQISIYDSDLKHMTETGLFPSVNEIFHHSIVKTDNGKTSLFIQKGNRWFILNYIQNPIFWLKAPFYFGVYLMILLLEYLIIKGHKIRTDKKRAIEIQISELQIKTIKNQVDPHFVFNAINTISEMVLTNDKEEADKFICHFSDLMRLTLNQSNKISHSLKNEIEYVEKYIKLQRVRFNDNFDYQIQIGENINQETLVPKHVLHTYIENAIKHGFSEKTEPGQLKISIKKSNNNLILSVVDNGKGFNNHSKSKPASTGNGLQIMDQIFDLYSKIHKSEISHSLNEIRNKNNIVIGVVAEIIISN